MSICRTRAALALSKKSLQALVGSRSCSQMATPEPSDMEVIHDTKEKEFYIQLKKGGDEHKAFLQYSYLKPSYVDLEHTVVPVEYRGHGIGAILARTAFDHFASQRIDMRPTCTYLQKFYHDNPTAKYKERVKWD